MKLVNEINTVNDPEFNRKKQMENVIRGKSAYKDTEGKKHCHTILAN